MRSFKIYIFLFLFLINCSIAFSNTGLSIKSDSLVYVKLKEVNVLAKAPRNKKYYRNSRPYRRTLRNFYLVYPYAYVSNKKIHQINKLLLKEKNKKRRKKIIRNEYKKIIKLYRKPLMKMKISQGKLLMKLIDRETGNSTYHHLKEMKGSTKAFFWQSIARMFGSNLKAKYDAQGKDWMVEEIFYRIEKGELPPPKKNIMEFKS